MGSTNRRSPSRSNARPARVPGGPLSYVDRKGTRSVVDRPKELASKYGARFTPAPMRVKMAEKGETLLEKASPRVSSDLDLRDTAARVEEDRSCASGTNAHGCAGASEHLIAGEGEG